MWVLAALLLVCVGAQPSPAQAQTLDPAIWQQSSTGMIKSPYGYVAGLGVIAHVTEGWPSLSIRGGAEGVGFGAIGGPVGIKLGAISVPGFQSATLARETTDWAHNAMTFTYGAPSPLKLWLSRLSPAVLMQTQASSLRLFTGDVTGNEFYTNDYGETDIRVTSGPSLPKYVAFPTGGQVQVRALSNAALNLNTMSGNWLLLWYGNNSHFLESKKPLSYSGAGWDAASMPNDAAYKADAPILVVFATRPTSIKHASTGGVELAFGAPAGYMSILPLTGRNNLKASDTEQWSGSLPTTIATRSNWWATRLCSYPVTVRESYSYNSASDTVVIGENFTFLNACSGGTRFAPIPPMPRDRQQRAGSCVQWSGDGCRSAHRVRADFGHREREPVRMARAKISQVCGRQANAGQRPGSSRSATVARLRG